MAVNHRLHILLHGVSLDALILERDNRAVEVMNYNKIIFGVGKVKISDRVKLTMEQVCKE